MEYKAQSRSHLAPRRCRPIPNTPLRKLFHLDLFVTG